MKPTLLLVLFALLIPASPAIAAKKVRKGPAGLAFYKPPKKLPARHGDAVWARKLKGEAALKSARSNRVVLYRSQRADGSKTAVSGVVSVPRGKAPKKGWPVITYAHGTTGIADQCAPSRDERSASVHGLNAYAYPLLNRWLKAGYAVVRTDYIGLGTPGDHFFLNGLEEGRSTLDIVRAAHELDKHISLKRVVISGHSQGGHAALWAASLAPKYAPDVKVRGTVAFAPASHIADQAGLLRAVSTPGGGLSGFVGMIARSIDEASPQLALPTGFGPEAAALYPATVTECYSDLSSAGSWGGLPLNKIFREDFDLAPFQAAVDKTDPDELKIKAPVLIEQGTADATVLPPFTDQLASHYKQLGNKVTYKTYQDVTHGGIVDAAAKDATKQAGKWLKKG
jgi:pimeloyl-ACP methyl ester carboxylesterase